MLDVPPLKQKVDGVFEIAELNRSLPAQAYETEEGELRTALLKAQTALGRSDFPVVVLLHGTDRSSTSAVLNVLNEWLDARYLTTEAWEHASEEERERPRYWRYWQWLPAKGRIGIFLGSWYTKPLWARVLKKLSAKAFDAELERAAAFEKLLTDDGALIVKVWLHTRKEVQEKRLAHDEHSKRRYRVRKRDRKVLEYYDEFVRVGAETLTTTSTGDAPWTIVEATDFRYRNVTVARLLVNELEKRLGSVRTSGPSSAVPAPDVATDPVTILDTLDLTLKLERGEYEGRLAAAQTKLAELALESGKRRRSVVIVFEGSDAAGKGGAIRRLTGALDARQYRVIPISAPSEEERAYHYLWRFWRRVPRRGRFTVYDRSWYGRVLVERVEGLVTDAGYRRAFEEINDFERQLVDAHGIVVKFWLQISSAEQARRFESRKREPWKQYKLTDEDYRNRAKSGEYEVAANEMIARTDTAFAPWTLIEAEDKDFARVKVVETVCARLEHALSR